MTAENLTIWSQVEKTNPEYTSKVDQRGGFTSIDAMYNIKRATEVFGPVGKGWAYVAEHSTIDLKDHGVLAVCDVTISYERSPNFEGHACSYGPVRATHPLVSKGRVDDDAPKKALTDALTKALSHLGFSADVFLGLFDDNKYLSELKRQFQPPVEKEPATDEEKRQAAIKWADSVPEIVGRIADLDRLESYSVQSQRVLQFLTTFDRARAIVVSGAIARRKEALLNAAAA